MVVLIQMLHLAVTAEVGLAMAADVGEMALGMVLGTTVEQALADMPAMEQTLTVVVAVVMPLLRVAVVVLAAGIQVPMAYRLVVV